MSLYTFLPTAAALLVFQWPPPAGHGDLLVEGSDNQGSIDSETLGEALTIINSVEPNTGSEIATSADPGGNGGVDIGVLDSNSARTYDGEADGDTVLVSEDLDPEERAAVLVHEWAHVQQGNDGSPGQSTDDSIPSCREAVAYVKQVNFMCARMTLLWTQSQNPDVLVTKPYTCSW